MVYGDLLKIANDHELVSGTPCRKLPLLRASHQKRFIVTPRDGQSSSPGDSMTTQSTTSSEIGRHMRRDLDRLVRNGT
jgi:hypothetical protein